MNDFDFSMYDYEEPAAPQKKEKVTNTKEIKEPEFDFGMYDYEEPPQESQPQEKTSYKKPLETPISSSEEYKKMSASEKIQYAKDLEREQRFGFSKAFSKGALSGATFGASENIPGFETEETEGEPSLAGGFGEIVGSAAPIMKIAKTLSPLTKAAFKNAPKVFQPLEKLMHSFGTGSALESGKQAVKGIAGKEVDISEIPKTGAAFATLDAFIRGAGALGKKFLGLSPKVQAEVLEKGIIPEGLPKSQYETAEEMLNLVKEKQAENKFPAFPKKVEGGEKPTALTSQRITAPEDIGLRPAPLKEASLLEDQVGGLFSEKKFYNSTEGGKALKSEIMKIDDDVYRGVNELYKTSKELNSGINEIHPELAEKVLNRVKELEAIPEPSDVQKRVIRASNNILEDLVKVSENGEISGYTPINNQTLIGQVQSLRQIVDYDFAHGNTKNIFRPLINDIQDSVLRAAENSGKPEAAQAINDARSAYRTWVEAFDNDYIRPFRDSSNKDFSKLYKSSLDLDESNVLRNILNISDDGVKLSNATTREIVEKNLGKYLENPRSMNTKEFEKTMRELDAVITPEQSQQVRELFRKESQPFVRAKKETPKKATPEEEIASKYKNSKPEDIQKKMNTRSGIKELREDFSKTPAKRDLFERLKNQKIRSVLREGNIEKEFTGDELYKFLNKEKNYELFSEMLGEAETESLRMSAKEIGAQQVKSEVRKKGMHTIAKKAAAYKAFELLINLL